MASSNFDNNAKDTTEDITCSIDFSDSVTEGGQGRKHDLRRTILQGSDADTEIFVCSDKGTKPKLYCDLCKEDTRKIVPAEGFCVDCNEYLCSSCFSFHKKQKNLKHTLKDKSSMPQDRQASSTNDVCTDKCPMHKDKIIEYFCQSCDYLGCSACFVTGHRACKAVDFIPDIISSKEIDGVFKQVDNDVQRMRDKLLLHKNRVASNIERSKQLRNKANEVIVKQRQEVKSAFDRLEKDMYAAVDEIYHNDQTNLTEVSDLVNSLSSEVAHVNSDLDSKSRNRCQLFVATKFAEKRLKAIECDVEKLKSSNKVQNLQYIPSHQLLDELANIEIGKINCVNSDAAKSIVSSRDINITHTDDKNNMIPRPTGICLLEKYRIVIIDSHRCTCSLVDLRTEQVISRVEFDDDPFDVTSLSDDELAVTFPYTGEIKFLVVGGDGCTSERRTINVGRGCSGIHYFNGNLVIAFKRCHGSKPRIDIIGIQGNVLTTIEKDDCGAQIFKSPYYVTVSPDLSTIYVSDIVNEEVLGMSMDGKVKGKYKVNNRSGDSRRPLGIIVDEDGSIFVCTSEDSSILQLSEDCEFIQVLLQNHDFRAITYCREAHCLYITEQLYDNISVVKQKKIRYLQTNDDI